MNAIVRRLDNEAVEVCFSHQCAQVRRQRLAGKLVLFHCLSRETDSSRGKQRSRQQLRLPVLDLSRREILRKVAAQQCSVQRATISLKSRCDRSQPASALKDKTQAFCLKSLTKSLFLLHCLCVPVSPCSLRNGGHSNIPEEADGWHLGGQDAKRALSRAIAK